MELCIVGTQSYEEGWTTTARSVRRIIGKEICAGCLVQEMIRKHPRPCIGYTRVSVRGDGIQRVKLEEVGSSEDTLSGGRLCDDACDNTLEE